MGRYLEQTGETAAEYLEWLERRPQLPRSSARPRPGGARRRKPSSFSWSAAGAVRGGGLGLVSGVLSGLLFALIELRFGGVTPLSLLLYRAGLSVWMIFALVGALMLGLVGFTFGGLSGSIIKTRTIINQGIRLSFANALLVGVVGGLLGGLMLGLIGLLIGLQTTPTRGAALYLTGASYSPYGIFIGLIAALWYGGLNVIQHYTLRLILWYQDRLPLFYTHFLNHSAEHILLRKVGGGYIFIHRLLLEHFAALERTTTNVERSEGESSGAI